LPYRWQDTSSSAVGKKGVHGAYRVAQSVTLDTRREGTIEGRKEMKKEWKKEENDRRKQKN
jgi:hypothetical protein